MSKRIDALVHAGMTSTEVADTLGISVEDYVAHGNGYAVIEYEPLKVKPKAKPRKKAVKAPQSDEEAPTAPADAEEA